jgi:hypothetical protein
MIEGSLRWYVQNACEKQPRPTVPEILDYLISLRAEPLTLACNFIKEKHAYKYPIHGHESILIAELESRLVLQWCDNKVDLSYLS